MSISNLRVRVGRCDTSACSPGEGPRREQDELLFPRAGKRRPAGMPGGTERRAGRKSARKTDLRERQTGVRCARARARRSHQVRRKEMVGRKMTWSGS
eukprot:scaffold1235_cov300-Pavlova_lutheri.AAC.6